MSDQRPPKQQQQENKKEPKLEQQNRKRRCSQTLSAEEKLNHAEKAIKALKRHSERGTCPESLKYTTRARIRADTEFKTDIKRIRKTAEQEFIKALNRFHYRETDRFRSEIKREKRPKVPNKTTNTDVTRFSKTKKETHSVNRESNETINNIYKIAENLEKRIAEFNNLMSTVKGKENKQFKQYTCLFSESLNNDGVKRKQLTKQLSNRKRKDRKQIKNKRNINAQFEANKNHIKNLSNKDLTKDQINLLAKGLKFIPTPVTNEKQIQLQLLRDFENFARRMRLKYIFHGQDKEPHPFHVKSTWKPPIQRSVALESYLEEVKIQLAEIKPTKPKNNLPAAEQRALKALKHDKEINLKKADKGTTTVVFNIQDKIKEGQIQLDNKEHYRQLEEPMVEETNRRVIQLVNELYHKNHIDETTKKWLCERPNPPRIPVFYTLTKIHKSTPVGRPIISGCDGPTEKLSSFVDRILQPIAKQ